MIRFAFHSTTLEPLNGSSRNTTDPVPDLIARLLDVEETKSGYQARCPAHEDDKASLSISRGDDGRALVFCHAGCSADQICRSLGWSLADLMPPGDGHDVPVHREPPKKEAIAWYNYTDETGSILFQIIRYVPKSFKRRRPDGKGGWIWNVEGVRTVPYRLHSLAENPGRTVVVVEGEKDVENLEAIGVLATCNAGGAGKGKWTLDHAAPLAGRNVIIVPDNDEPGRNHATHVARTLDGVAKSVRVVNLPGPNTKGRDVSDWIADGGSRDELLELARLTPEWRDPLIHEDNQPGPVFKQERPPTSKRIEVISARDFAAKDYRPNWLVNRILVAGQPAICGGRSKAMKTSNLVDLAVSIGTGTPFLGKFETSRQTVAILSGESGAFTIQETANRVARARGVNLADADVFFGFHLPQIARLSDVDATLAMLEETTAKVLIIDPAYLCVLGGDTSGRQATNVFDMGPLLLRLSELGEKTGSTIVMCHHCRKSPGDGRDKYDPPDLEELSMAGFAEWARQWVLIGRREAFEAGTGLHKLWLNVGGSAGFSGTWSVDIDEGILDDDFGGRKWDVTVGTIEDAKEEKEQSREKSDNKRREKMEWEHQRRVASAMRLAGGPMTRNQIRDATGLNSKNVATAINTMRQKGHIKSVPFDIRGKEYEGFVLTEKASQDVQNDSSEGDSDGPQKFDFPGYDRF